MARVTRTRKRTGGSRYKSRPTTSRRSGRIKRRRSTRSTIPRSVTPFPRTRLVRHKYVENFTHPAASAAGFSTYYNFYANSMFDPNRTGTGHQPLYNDEMAAMYMYYTVIGSYIKVTFDQTSTNQCNYGIILGQDESISTSGELLCEHYKGTNPLITSQRNGPLVLRKSFDAKRLFKTDLKGLMVENDHRVAVGSNPSTKSSFFYNVWRAPTDSTVTLSTMTCQVELVLVCMWREPKDPTSS